MRAWLQALAPRERAVLFGAGGVLLLLLVYLVVLEPLAQAYAARETRVRALEQELEWMRDAAAEVRALGGTAADTAGAERRPPYLAADRALREAGLPRPTRLEPVGSQGARLEIEAVAFDALVRVLRGLRTRDGLRVERARFERVAEGRVDAAVDLERSQ